MMDRIDSEIISKLQKDGRTPFTDIAKELGISEGTVRNRVSRLVEDNIIQIVALIDRAQTENHNTVDPVIVGDTTWVAMTDPVEVGFDAPAMIGVTVEPPQVESVAETVAQMQEVSYLIMVSGEFDLFVEVLCKDRAHLAEFLNQKLRRVTGVVRTQTFMTLKTYKMAYGAPPMLPDSRGHFRPPEAE
jgi:Lrp/AsnC family transcriptional regulator, regulator for asnA, asnC and gidA